MQITKNCKLIVNRKIEEKYSLREDVVQYSETQFCNQLNKHLIHLRKCNK